MTIKTLTVTVPLLCLPLLMAAQGRHALVIGLGRQQDPAWGKVNGDKDVPKVTEMLRANGFSDIRSLVNEKATKVAIGKELSRLSKVSRKGDIVYIHFSGHGQRVTDLDGDEPDGWDEAWIPYDAYRHYSSTYHGENHLIDDELYDMLEAIRKSVGENGTIAVVVDACHSGDSTRGDSTQSGNDVEEECVRGVFDTFDIPGERAHSGVRREERWVTLSACQPYQLNQEYNGMGKLTYLLYSHWSDWRHLDNRILLENLDSRMQTRELSGRYPQNPALTGDGTRFCNIFK